MTKARLRVEKRTPDGYEIVVREQAYGPHPHPSQNGREVPYTGVAKLLVLVPNPNGSEPSEVELFECNDCGRTNVKRQSIVAHMNAHNESRENLTYDEHTLRHLLRTVKRLQRDGVRPWAIRTAELLNEQGIKPYRAEVWTAGMVSNLVSQYGDKIRVHVRARLTASVADDAESGITPASDSSVAPVAPVAAPDATLASTEFAVQRVTAQLQRIHTELARVSADLLDVAGEVAELSTVDPELLEKAQKYDQLRGLFN